MASSPRFPSPWRNWISLAGAIIALGSLFAFLLLFAIDLFAHNGNPYMGILAYVVAPGFLLLGMALVLAGLYIQRRHRRKLSPETAGTPNAWIIDLSRPRDRKVLAGFVAGGVVFLMLTAFGSNRTYHYTESVEFCGLACHTPMKPEYTAYLDSPHARVECTACHVGPGATWYVKSKINGVRQLYCTLTDTFDRPIETPVRNLRPAQDTCEQCHWPEKFVGNVERTYQHYLADESNTLFSVRLSLLVGGGDSTHGKAQGIHWHMNLANQVEYIATDHQRQVIPWVRVTAEDGTSTVYRDEDFTDDPSQHTIRKMDCIDCHNRPAHQFHSPNEAVDFAMAAGRIDPALPWVKSNVVHLLTRSYETEPQALASLDTSLRELYPDAPELSPLIEATQNIFKRNFFPEMKADWRAYPDNISHKNSAGCFRCHDGSLKSEDGTGTIGASTCTSCHTILAQGDAEQMMDFQPDGHEFFWHIDAPNEDFTCADCHTGALQEY